MPILIQIRNLITNQITLIEIKRVNIINEFDNIKLFNLLCEKLMQTFEREKFYKY